MTNMGTKAKHKQTKTPTTPTHHANKETNENQTTKHPNTNNDTYRNDTLTTKPQRCVFNVTRQNTIEERTKERHES